MSSGIMETQAQSQMERPEEDYYIEQMENIVKILAKIMFYGNWEWETPNERALTMLMQNIGLYPFKDEDKMIKKTKVDESIYEESRRRIK